MTRTRLLWNVGRGLLRLDARELNQLGPLLGFVGDELSEVGGRTRKHVTSKVGEAALYRGIGESAIDLFVKLFDNFCGRGFGRADSIPSIGFVARVKLVQRRGVRQNL